MDQDNIEDSLVAAINGNDWNRIYCLASPSVLTDKFLHKVERSF